MVGQAVKIISWEQAGFIASFLERTTLGAEIRGVIRHVDPQGDVWVQVEGLKREYAFAIGQLERI